MLWRLAFASLWSRRGSVLLTFLAITVSVFVLLGVEQVRHQAKNSFGNTVSGIDLIVGARTGDINLLLYSVFQLGNATNNIAWSSYQQIAAQPEIAWSVPISLGDSHFGYRVMGTTRDYFQFFRYGRDNALQLAEGTAFNDLFDVVLGSQVASALGYQPGSQLVLAHGLGRTSFSQHDDKPFTVVGILRPTGTPVDQTLLVSLEAISAIHLDWQNGVKMPGRSPHSVQLVGQDLTPESITAVMLGLKSKLTTFRVQRQINTYQGEPLLAILPGVTLTQLWQVMSAMENTLRLISALVLLASLLGLAAMLLVSIRERRREIALMRTIGASPWFILLLIEVEGLVITLGGALTAVLLLAVATAATNDFLAERYSLFLDGSLLTANSMSYLLVIVLGGLVVGLIPGITAYRRALQQQLVS